MRDESHRIHERKGLVVVGKGKGLFNSDSKAIAIQFPAIQVRKFCYYLCSGKCTSDVW